MTKKGNLTFILDLKEDKPRSDVVGFHERNART